MSLMNFARLVSVSFLIGSMLWSANILSAQEHSGEKSTSDGDKRSKPRILILGDSISIGYTKFVQDSLKDVAVVFRPMNKYNPQAIARSKKKNKDQPKGAENCAGTKKGVTEIDRWLKIDGGNWDVIHFNFGLHDLKRVKAKTGKNSNDPNDPQQSNPEQYEKNLRNIVGKLKATGAELIFATTTPVPEGGVKPYRDPADPARYNDIAKKIMKQNDIAINDLYGFANDRLEKIQQKVNVHFTAEGSKALGDQVVKHIKAAIEKTNSSKTRAYSK
jgi:acyl-CoA thioesterase-1